MSKPPKSPQFTPPRDAQIEIASIRNHFEIVDGAPSEPDDGGLETKILGPLGISRLRSVATRRVRRRRETCADDYFLLFALEEGGHLFDHPGGELTAVAPALILLDPDPLLEIEGRGAAEALAVSIPARLLAMYFPDAPNWGVSMRASADGPPAVLHELVRSCWSQRSTIRQAEAVELGRALVQLAGAVFSKPEFSLTRCKSRSTHMHWMRIRDFVAKNISHRDLSPEFVCQNLKISPSYLFEILNSANTKLRRVVLELRLERAREMLTDKSMNETSISDIANAAGFRRLSHFSCSFSARYGETPRAFRLAARRRGGAMF